MSEGLVSENEQKNRYHFDRHTPEYRFQFEKITQELHEKCPVAWSDTYGGHWVASSSKAVFELPCPTSPMTTMSTATPRISGHHHSGQADPPPSGHSGNGSPEHRWYRNVLNPYLSPAAVKRWEPFINEVVRASLDDKIETGRLDFVDDLANVAPAV